MTLVGRHPLRRKSAYKIYYGNNVLKEIQSEMSRIGDPFPNPIGHLQTLHLPFTLEGNNKFFDVTIDLFDMQGKRVKQMTHQQLISGYHEVQWDGKDESGSTCAQGMYIVRVMIGNSGKQISFHKRVIVNQQP
jgi:flagellar hook assembly protein FlgD